MGPADDGETVYVSGFVAVASLADVPPGAKKLVEVSGVEVLLCNSVDRIFAVENLCSHAEEKLDCGRMRSGWIACPVHGARFDLATGEALNPPATQPIQTWPVRISGDTIEVAL
jgi:3-phenylpropionate/trans-cinnamate dioxygenase ferredoxin subunit